MLQNIIIWRWSPNHKPQSSTTLNIFIMRFSSLFLIAAAVAAIAGSTIASPGLLHARALEVNSLESKRDVDIYSRQPLLNLDRHLSDHYVTARFLKEASKCNRQAAKDARMVADVMPESRRSGWLRQAEKHTEMADGYASMHDDHMHATKEPHARTELCKEVYIDRDGARAGKEYALRTSRDARKALSERKPSSGR